MSNQSLLSQYIRYTAANIIAALGISCYVLADTLFIANGVGSLGLSALNLSLPIYNLINGLGLMFGIGCSSAFCILNASKRTAKANALFTSALLLGLLCGIVFSLTGLLFARPIAVLMGADSETVQMTTDYLHILLSFAPLFMLQNVFVAFVRCAGAPGTAMTATFAGCLFNIIFDYIFIFPCDLGIAGAALATVMSPLVGILISCIFLAKNRDQLRLLGLKAAFCALRDSVSDSLRFGTTAFLTEFTAGIVMAIYNFVILSITGNIGVAAYGIIANLAIVVLAIFTGITQGMQPLCSTAYGKGDGASVKKLLRYGLVTALILSVLIYLAVILFQVPIAGAFGAKEGTLLQQLTLSGIVLYFAGFFAAGCNMILSAHASACARPKPALLITLLRGFLLIALFAFLCGRMWGMTGVWLSFPLTETVTLAAAIVLMRRQRKSERL